ncbi:MAG: aspartate--ammonia ligase [Planctomycetota bacterium]|nr:aspartate--ammonia ligase [Planctomycetota bacterium]
MSLAENYTPYLDIKETERAIKYIKDLFQVKLANALNLLRVSAPVVVLKRTGVNDYLNSVEKPARFFIKCMKEEGEIVQSLAKWKRVALADYGFRHGEGLYTDMNAVRPSENLDNLHSLYVDQWDWERVISEEERNLDFLKEIVRRIYSVIKEVEEDICKKYPQLPPPFLPSQIRFFHSEELEELFPDASPQEREERICEEYGAVFVIGIGAPLKNGRPHDGRAADYDDWLTETGDGRKGLNGDILVFYPPLKCAMELSSMGIRVNRESLLKQLKIRNELHKKNLWFHKRLLKGALPLSIGGGIGQSRLCMLFLRKIHIGEVQSSIWPDKIIKFCKKKNIPLL